MRKMARWTPEERTALVDRVSESKASGGTISAAIQEVAKEMKKSPGTVQQQYYALQKHGIKPGKPGPRKPGRAKVAVQAAPKAPKAPKASSGPMSASAIASYITTLEAEVKELRAFQAAIRKATSLG